MKTSNKKKKNQFKSFITNKKNIAVFIFLILLIILSIGVYLKSQYVFYHTLLLVASNI